MVLSLYLMQHLTKRNNLFCNSWKRKMYSSSIPQKIFKKALARVYMHSVEVFAIYFFGIYNKMEQLLCNQYSRTCCNKPCNDASYFIWKKVGVTTIGSIQRKCEGYIPGNLSVRIVYYHLRYEKTRRYCGLI